MAGIGSGIGTLAGAGLGMAVGMPFLGAALGGVAGGLFDSGEGGVDVGAQQQFSMQQLQMQQQFQREMARNSIQMRVADAKDAGVSPLVALGAPTFNPSASITPVDYGAGIGRPNDMSGAIGRMGQALGDLSKNETAMAMQANAIAAARESHVADIGLKGAQTRYWDAKANEITMPALFAPQGGLAGQGPMRVGRQPVADPTDRSITKGDEPNYTFVRTGPDTVMRIFRPEVMASASVFNPEYWKAQAATAHASRPPESMLSPGHVYWEPGPGNQYRSSPYWPGERVGSPFRGNWEARPSWWPKTGY